MWTARILVFALIGAIRTMEDQVKHIRGVLQSTTGDQGKKRVNCLDDLTQ